MTKFTREYLEFRETLNNDHLLNLRAQLKNMLADGAIQENTLMVLEIGGALLFHIYIDRSSDTVWLLGGHWVRNGEPTKSFLERMNYFAVEIMQGREPH